MEFVHIYQRFQQIVNDGDERIANILRCYLQPCHQQIHLDPISRVILSQVINERFHDLDLVISNIWIDFPTKTIERSTRSVQCHSSECDQT